MVAGVAATISALLSVVFATLLYLSNFHFPARALITLMSSLAFLPGFVVAPFTAASAAMK
jgi:hypothetical protein